MDEVVESDEVEAGGLEAEVDSGGDRCRLAELQPAARRAPTPTAAAAVAKLIERMLEVSGSHR
jgi:hypothetical protein